MAQGPNYDDGPARPFNPQTNQPDFARGPNPEYKFALLKEIHRRVGLLNHSLAENISGQPRSINVEIKNIEALAAFLNLTLPIFGAYD